MLDGEVQCIQGTGPTCYMITLATQHFTFDDLDSFEKYLIGCHSIVLFNNKFLV